MTEELYEVVIGGSMRKRQEMYAWATDTFGDHVEPHDSLPILYFRNKADAEFFMLRWA
jgi:hypothetical protein